MRARARAGADPTGMGRMHVQVPGSDHLLWAPRVFPLTPFGDVDVQEDVDVWLGFENDALDSPVVLGLVEPLQRSVARTLQVERMGDAWDQGHAAGSRDGTQGSDTPNPYR